MKFRFYYSHCGDAPTSEVREFPDNTSALTELARMRQHEWYQMDKIRVERIDVEEKTTPIG